MALIKTYNSKTHQYERTLPAKPISAKAEVVLLKAKLEAILHAPDMVIVRNIARA
jgi:hypothetical protein